MRAVLAWESGQGFLETYLNAFLDEGPIPPPDRALAMELAHGIVRWKRTLDQLIDLKAERKPEGAARVLLQLGLYQLFWLSRVPDYAAVDETIRLARERGLQHQSGFMNALLRNYGREREATVALLESWRKSDPGLGFSYPDWLVSRWREYLGEGRTLALLQWHNQPPPTHARVNRLKAEPGQLLEAWRMEDVQYDFGRWSWVEENQSFQLKSHPSLNRLESFRNGWFYIQDPSTHLAVSTLAARPGESILDLCAAPGGKTCYIAQTMRNEGRILASDTSEERLGLLRQNAARLGATNIQVRLLPETTREPGAKLFPEAPFDRVLVDAPCSNTGVLRRRVDLRWRLQPTEISRLAALQTELLERASQVVRPGGLVVYSTCSLEPDENETVVRSFLKSHPDFALDTARQLHPLTDGVDGAFVAGLRKLRNAPVQEESALPQ